MKAYSWVYVRTVRNYKTGKMTATMKVYLCDDKTILKEVSDFNAALMYERLSGPVDNSISVYLDELTEQHNSGKPVTKTKIITPKQFKEYSWPEKKQLTF